MLPTATTSKPTLENVFFMIQQLTTSVNYSFNDMCANFNSVLEENKLLREEITFLKQQVSTLKGEIGTLKALVDGIPSAEDYVEVTATFGLFTGNMFPDRNIPEPRIKDTRPGRKSRSAPFPWKRFRWANR